MTNYNYEEIGKKLVALIKERPFGTIPKRELDIFLFSLLYNNRTSSTKSTPFQISRELQISQSKVENLIYEMNLRDINEIPQIKGILKRFSYNEATKTISIPIDNKYEKEFIENVFVESNIVFDGSFNKNLLKLNLDSFGDLLDNILTKEESKNFIEQSYKIVPQITGVNIPTKKETIKEVMVEFLKIGVTASVEGIIKGVLS